MKTISKAPYRDLLDADASPEELVIAYHERTKHYFHRYAASLGCMDWATQPIRFDAIQEPTSFAFCCRNPAVRFLTGSSTRLRTYHRSRCRGLDLSLLPVRAVFDRVETFP